MNGKERKMLGATIGGAASGPAGVVVGGPVGAGLGAVVAARVDHEIGRMQKPAVAAAVRN